MLPPAGENRSSHDRVSARATPRQNGWRIVLPILPDYSVIHSPGSNPLASRMLGGNEMSNTLTPLEGKTALVTGGTAGIGLACAGALLAAGVTGLVINGRSSERAEQARSGLATRHP